MPFPTIETTPALGLTQSVAAATGATVVDVRTEDRGYPFITPEENIPEDDAHRINHFVQRVDADVADIELASLLGLPAYMIMDDR